MKRVVVFAHYSKNNVIEDYVICYLKGLKTVANTLIFISDSDLAETELKKIDDLVAFAIAEKHWEYDFGSYKRGYFYLKNNNLLENYDELILCNDSCYAPLFPFSEMFGRMSALPVDFWGASENPKGFDLVAGQYVVKKIRHVQSFFIVFKKQIFLNDSFGEFWKNVKHEESKFAVICNYEIGLSKILLEHGFKYDVYSSYSKLLPHATTYHYDKLIKKDRLPLLKRNIVLRAVPTVYPLGLKRLIFRYTDYDYKLIENDVEKNITIPNPWTVCKIIRYFFRNLRHNIYKFYPIPGVLCLFGYYWHCNKEGKSNRY